MFASSRFSGGGSGPYFLGGWSLGGQVAYEMARVLTARGRGADVALVILVDTSFHDTGTRARWVFFFFVSLSLSLSQCVMLNLSREKLSDRQP